MKHSQTVGLIATLALIAACFLPWCIIDSKQITITGLSAPGTHFGKPGLMNIFFCVLSAVFFAVPKVWAKRTNMFLTMCNFAWCVRNYLILTTCYFGECPQKQIGLYVALICAAVMMLASLFPKMKLV